MSGDEKKVPEYITSKLAEAQQLGARLHGLECEVENWLEDNGIDDAYEFVQPYVLKEVYAIKDLEGLTKAIGSKISR